LRRKRVPQLRVAWVRSQQLSVGAGRHAVAEVRDAIALGSNDIALHRGFMALGVALGAQPLGIDADLLA